MNELCIYHSITDQITVINGFEYLKLTCNTMLMNMPRYKCLRDTSIMSVIVLYLIIFILIIHNMEAQMTRKNNEVLSRKKRWLSFPENSNFVVSS